MKTAPTPLPEFGTVPGVSSNTLQAAVEAADPLPLPPSHLTELLNIQRLSEHLEKYPELKDPCVVATPDGSYTLFASIGSSVTQQWIVGRFIAQDLLGPWIEHDPVVFEDISGPQLCAPAVTYEEENGQPLWKMYIQTACFEEDGVIALATSVDGKTFKGLPQPLATRTTVLPEHQQDVIGVYDVGVSQIKTEQDDLLCMLFSGYRRVGCGDLYASYKKKNAAENEWSTAQRLLSQEEVPFHNNPTYEHYEWGLEGAKLIQITHSCYLLIGVCFQPKPYGHEGTRQRVFFATASHFNGPFIPVGMPFQPIEVKGQRGENGHPDTIVVGNDLWVIYQERWGDKQPWHLRITKYTLSDLEKHFMNILEEKRSQLYA